MKYSQLRLQRHSSGFTLIEILVVVLILGILGTYVVPKLMEHPVEARITKAHHDIGVIQEQLRIYKMHNFNYPSTDQGLQALVTKPSGSPEAPNWMAGGYLDDVPKDPWGKEYQYLNPGTHGDVDIFTLGADGRPGGEGENADIGNWSE